MIKLRFKALSSGKYSVYLDIYYKDRNNCSKRIYEFLNIHVRKDYSKVKRILEADRELMEIAKGIKAKREIEYLESKHGFERKKENRNINVLSYLEDIYNETEEDGILGLLKHLKGYSGRDKLNFSDFTDDFLEGFKNYLLTQISSNTTRNYLKRLRSYFNKAIKLKLIEYNPLQNLVYPVLREIDRTTLTLEEIKQLEGTPTGFNPAVRTAFIFSCFSGLRMSDIKILKWDDIQNGQIVLMPKKTTQTSGKMLYLPLTNQAKKILSEIENEYNSEYVFPTLPSKKHITDCVRAWGKKAGIKKRLYFHAARHTFATLGLSFGVDLYTMQKLLGHSKIEMTQQYAKIIDEKKRAEVAKFPNL